jgi:hypothetical protein
MEKLMILPMPQRNLLVSALEMYKATLSALPDDWKNDEAFQTIKDCDTLCRLMDGEVVIQSKSGENVSFQYGHTSNIHPVFEDIFGTLGSMLNPSTINK